MIPTRVAPSDLSLGLVPHSGSFSLAAPQREALAALRAALADNYPFILLAGDAGTGKTTVARGLLERLDPDRYALGGMFGPYGEGDALLAHTVQDFAVRPPRRGDSFLTLEDFLGQCGSGSREAVLVIDEAQALDSNALRQLWHLVVRQAERRPLLQVVLVGVQIPAALDELVRDSELLPIGARVHLRRLKHAETRDFVLHRLRSRERTALPTFSPDALIAIHERSAGVMRRAGLLCDRILMWLELEGVRDVSAQVVQAVDTQVRGEWSGLKSEETAARTGEPKPAARAAVSYLTPVERDIPAPTVQPTATPSQRAPPPDGRLASVPSLCPGLASPSDAPFHAPIGIQADLKTAQPAAAPASSVVTTATPSRIAPPPDARRASARSPTPGLAPPSAPSDARTGIHAEPKSTGPAAGPPPATAGNAEAWDRLSALARQGRMPTKLLAGLLLLGLAVLAGLAMQWGLRAPPLTFGSERAATGSTTVYMPGESLPLTQGQQPVAATPAAPPAALPATSPPSRLVSRPPPARTAAPRAALVESVPPTPASAVCSGAAEALGLCAVAAPALSKAPALPTRDARPAPAQPACTPEGNALGLCDTP